MAGNNLSLSVTLSAIDRITGPFRGVQKATQALSDSMKKSQQTLGKIDAFRKLKNETLQTSKEMTLAQQRVRDLAQEIKNATGPTDALNKKFEAAKKIAQSLKQAHAAEQEQLQRLRTSLSAAGQSTANLTESAKKLNDKMAAQAKWIERIKTLQKGLNATQVASGKVMEGVGSVMQRGAVVGAGLTGVMYLFKREFVDTAAKFERFQAILETTEGSSDKARTALNWVSEFAAKTPFELEEVTEGFVKLRAYGLDPVHGLMKSLGDASAAMGKPLSQAVEAIADAVTGENERLKEFGIKARKQGQMIAYEYTINGQTMTKRAQASSREQIQATLESIWNDKYAGAMEKRSRTWEGMMSNLADQWVRFKNLVMQSGVFDAMRAKLESFLVKLDQMAASGELQAIAKEFGVNLLEAFKKIEKVATELASALSTLGRVADQAAKILGGYDNLALMLIALPLATPFVMLAAALMQIGSVAGPKALGVLGKIAGVSAAAGVGYSVGSLIYDKGIKGTAADSFIGKNAARVAAFFGNDEAKQALAMNQRQQQFNGKLDISINSEGRAKVKQMSASGGFEIDVDTGPMMVMP